VRAIIHVVGSGTGRAATASAIVTAARRRGLTAHDVPYPPGRVVERSSFLSAMRTMARYLLARARWRVQYRSGVIVVDGHWYDSLAGHALSAEDSSRALTKSRALWPMMPRASVAVVLDDHNGHRVRPSEDEDWRPWMWLQLAPWFADRVEVTSANGADAGRVLDALASPPQSASAWATVPVARHNVDLRVTMGDGASVAAGLHEPIRHRELVARVNHGLVRHRLCIPNVAPIDGLAELCASCGVEPDALATLRTEKPGRLLVGAVVDEELRLVLKLGPVDDAALRTEASALENANIDGVAMPKLVWSGEWQQRFAVATVGLAGYRKAAHARPADVVDMCLSLARAGRGDRAVVHGDLAPWNLLVPKGGRVRDAILVDWEHVRYESDPLYDLAHFVVQRAWLLGRATPAQAIADLTQAGSPGWTYLEGLGLDARDAPDLVRRYLRAAPRSSAFHDAMLDLLD
jgi:hypothetical protein